MKPDFRKKRTWFYSLLLIAILLIIARIALPYWLKDYINGNIDTMGEYHGSIDDVDLSLWRGNYSLKNLTIVKSGGDFPVPLLEVPVLDFSLAWRELFGGHFVANATFFSPELSFVDGKDDNNQDGGGVNWRSQLESLAPFTINELRIVNGTISFRNFNSDPQVDVKVHGVGMVARNLTNIGNQDDRAADFSLKGKVFGEAMLEVDGEFDPFNVLHDFRYRVKTTEVDLLELNDLFRAYANVDVSQGVGELVMELQARDGQLSGYAKPLLTDVEVFSWKQDVEKQGDNPLRLAWEALTGLIEDLFKNQEQNQFATRVEISGTIDDAQTSTWEAIRAILVNAFVEAFKPQFEKLPERDREES